MIGVCSASLSLVVDHGAFPRWAGQQASQFQNRTTGAPHNLALGQSTDLEAVQFRLLALVGSEEGTSFPDIFLDSHMIMPLRKRSGYSFGVPSQDFAYYISPQSSQRASQRPIILSIIMRILHSVF